MEARLVGPAGFGILAFGASNLEAFGQVESVSIIKDKFTGRSKGFGFVEMPTQAEAEAAIAGLNGKDLRGRPLRVNEARPKPEGGRGGENRGF